MTEQRLEYAKSVLEQKQKVTIDLNWLEGLPELSPLNEQDSDRLKQIAYCALEALHSRIVEEFKKL